MDKKTLILLSVVFIDLVGFGIVIPLLPLLIENIGGNAFLVGVTISVFSLFQFLFSPILGRLSDKYGRKPILIVSSFLNSMSYFLIFFSQAFWIIILARIIAGIGSANVSVAQAYIADISSAHERTRKIALVGAAFGLGFIVGPFLGGVVGEQFSISAPFLIPGILSLLNTVLIFIFLPESNTSLQKHIKIEFLNLKVTREIIKPKNMFFLLFLYFFVNFALSLTIGIFPLLSQIRFGWNEAQNGYYFALIGIGSFITQVFFIRLLLKKFTEVDMIKMGLIIFGIAMTVIGLAVFGWIVLLIGVFTSIGFSLLNANLQSLVSLESKENEQGIVLGVAASFASLARVFGPLVGGFIGSFHIGLPYIASGLITIFIVVAGNKYLRLIKVRSHSKPPELTLE